MDVSEFEYLLALITVPGVGPITSRTLISYCGSPKKVFKKSLKDLLKIPGVGAVTAKAIHAFSDFKRIEKELHFIEKHKIKTFTYLDSDFPFRLKNPEDAPVVLFYKGNASLNPDKSVAIIGTRHITEYGKKMTEKLVEGLSSSNVTVLSGLAYGIDIAAHKSALKNNLPTIAVMGTGLDLIYPAHHRNVAMQMIENGGLLTEFFSATKPDKENFPRRNRIVAALSDAVVVIESAVRGGSLITAEIANSYNRDVFAIPGRTDDEYSGGCNDLIKKNKAVLIESAQDLLYAMRWDEESSKKNIQKKIFIDLTADEMAIMEALQKSEAMHVDELSQITKFDSGKLATTLLQLEFKSAVLALPGKRYRVI